MSTVKIKTEPATVTTATVDLKVKLEPSLSTADIKLEQQSSDIDTKVEFDSEADIKSESDDDDQFTITPKKQRQFICEHPGCSRRFKSAGHLSKHRHEHRLQADIEINGKTFILTRQSLDGRWPCPIPDCTSTVKTVDTARSHVRRSHGGTIKQLQQQQMPQAQMTRYKYYFFDVDDFYVNGVRCGYHNPTAVFICHECKLVPECLLTHLQQKHGFDEKSIDNSALPESAVTANADPNGNQHGSNTHLALAISQPYQQHPQDIVQGWLCVTSDCGYCGYTADNKAGHKRKSHQGEQISTVPALVLRLVYARSRSYYFFITRIDRASGAATTKDSRVSQNKLDYSHSGLNAHGVNEDDINQIEITKASNWMRQFICEYSNCGLLFNSADQLSMHRREHKFEVEITVHGTTYTLSRQSLTDRWPCPVPECEKTWKTIYITRVHIQKYHSTRMKQKPAKSEDDDNQQQLITKKRQRSDQYLNVDDFYVSRVRCGYHNPTGLFICYKCRLVPECLLLHLQQKHGYDEKSIDSTFLPDSARINGDEPNGNQHTSSLHIAAAIRKPNQQHHPDIATGWLCVVSDCGYCCSTNGSVSHHQYREHRGKQRSTVPALVLRLLYAKTRGSCFLITQSDTATNGVNSNSSISQHNSNCDDDDDDDDEDGDELVLSDMGSDDDIY